MDRVQCRGALARAAGASIGSTPQFCDGSGSIPVLFAAPAVQVLRLSALGSRHWRIVGCSAVTGEGLQEAFGWVVDDIASRVYLLD